MGGRVPDAPGGEQPDVPAVGAPGRASETEQPGGVVPGARRRERPPAGGGVVRDRRDLAHGCAGSPRPGRAPEPGSPARPDRPCTGSVGQSPVTMHSAYTSSGSAQSRCTNREAVGAASSHPAAATSDGFAAATNETVSGSCSAPTSKWVSGRSAAAWRAGEAVRNSSKNAMDGPRTSPTRAQAGGASVTEPSPGQHRQTGEVAGLVVADDQALDVPAAAADSTTAVLPSPGCPTAGPGCAR